MTLKKLKNGIGGARRITVRHQDVVETLYLYHRRAAAVLGKESYVSTTPNRADIRIDGEIHSIYVLFPVGDKLVLIGAYDDGDGDKDTGVILYLELTYGEWRVGGHYFEFDNDEVNTIQGEKIAFFLSELMRAG